MRKPTIGIVSLGCPRNLVDSELMLGLLKSKGYTIRDDVEGSDIALINTCAFVDDAKKEAIDVIMKASDLKGRGLVKKIIVCGCLGQRYAKVLKREIPEIDSILGVDDFKNIDKAVASVLEDEKFISINPPDALYSHKDPRMLITPRHYAYVKIAEGCNNRCSYCAIYKIRGDFRSRDMGSVLTEIRQLGARKRLPELNIIAQDTTSYGIDKYKAFKLAALLKKICGLGRAHWIRLLYTHPRHLKDELIDVIASEAAVCKYIDLPIQHINDKILERMNRKVKRVKIEKLISRIRKKIPDVAIRTSLIVGFPGETDRDFSELLDFVKEIEFERLGAFMYSREDGTKAYSFKDQIPEKIKQERFDALMSSQQDVSKKVNEKFMGRVLEVLVEERDADQKGLYIGRTQYDAPDVDGQVYIRSKKNLKPGDFVKVKIADTMEYDLSGTTLEHDNACSRVVPGRGL